MQELKEPLLGNKDGHKNRLKLDSEGFKTPRYMGFAYQFMFVFLICCQQVLAKIIFERHPSMTPTLLLFLRSATSVVLLVTILNNKLKEYLYDKIDPKLKWKLTTRVILGVLVIVCIYTSVKSLPLVIVGVVTNLSPLFTALLSLIILKKAITKVDSFALVVSFVGVVILITGG
jgi:drug/metabolite transporter (DMT)-like permease